MIKGTHSVRRRASIVGLSLVAVVSVGTMAWAQVGVRAPDSTTFTFTNVEVVSINASVGTLVFRAPGGQTRTLAVAPGLTGFQDLRPGDRIVVGLEGEPGTGLERIASIQSRTTPGPASGRVMTPTSVGATNVNAQVVEVNPASRMITVRVPQRADQVLVVDPSVSLDAFRAGDKILLSVQGTGTKVRVVGLAPEPDAVISGGAAAAIGAGATALSVQADAVRQAGGRDLSSRLATLARRADEIDRIWTRYRTECDASVASNSQLSREWFVLWEGGGTPGNTVCDELHDEIVQQGEALKSQVAAAEDMGRTSGVQPGTIRELLAGYSLDGSGWSSARPPARRR